MIIDRRTALSLLGMSGVAAIAGSCRQEPTSAPAAPPADQRGVSLLDRKVVDVLFTGLNLYVASGGGLRISLPHGPGKGKGGDHVSRLVILGGNVEPPSKDNKNPGLVVQDLTGYSLQARSDVTPKGDPRIHTDAPQSLAPSCPPDSQDGWKSLHWIINFQRLYPNATLKKGWDSRELSSAMIEVDTGEFFALAPGQGFGGLWEWTPKDGQASHQQYMTNWAQWSIPVVKTLSIDLNPLPGNSQPPTTIAITPNGGPLFVAVMHVIPGSPVLDMPSQYAHLENMFDGISGDPVRPKKVQEREDCRRTLPGPRIPAGVPQLLIDGSPACPPGFAPGG